MCWSDIRDKECLFMFVCEIKIGKRSERELTLGWPEGEV